MLVGEAIPIPTAAERTGAVPVAPQELSVDAAPRQGCGDRFGHLWEIELLETIVGRDRGILRKAAVDDGCAEAHDPWMTRRSRARRVRGARRVDAGAGSGRPVTTTAACAVSSSLWSASRRS